MTHTCCPDCRLRFTRATASGLAACPRCGEQLSTRSSQDIVGLPLWEQTPRPPALPGLAAAVALAAHRGPGRS